MTNVKTVPVNGNKPEQAKQARERLRAHRDFYLLCDPYTGYSTLIHELKAFNAELDYPLNQGAVSKIGQEVSVKRQLVPKERTRQYLIHHGRKNYNPNSDLTREQQEKALARELRIPNVANCEYELSEHDLLEVARAVVNGEDEAEIGVLMSDVEAEAVTWLWDRRIPLGKLTLLEGDPDKGKSVITMDLAARVTTGRRFPNDEQDDWLGQLDNHESLEKVDNLAAGVVVLDAEDGLADTIKPRLEAAGSDVSKVLALPAINPDDTLFGIPRDIPRLERAIRRVDARLVIVDPLAVFMKGDPNKDNEVRKALTPLADMVERLNVAVVVVRHFNKNGDAKALYRGGGSIGIIGAARSALAVAPHPHDDDMKVLVPQKGNLSKKAATLAYSIEDCNGVPRIQWKGSVNFQADEVLNPDVGSKVGEARDWLRELLKSGPVPAETVEAKRKAAGHSLATLNRAKKGVAKSERINNGSGWEWSLIEGYQDAQPYQASQDSQDSQDRQLVAVK
jgi:hypothetical protein